ncbi:MAG: NAD(P)-dependent oxidoreductase [Candidatus Woesebacteria bacterium]|jgi:D-lactate dehydrogenase
MSKIAFYSAKAEDRSFFKNYFKDTKHELAFYPCEINISELDKDTEVLSVFVDVPVTKDIIKALPRLKLIACRSTGYNNVDLKAAKDHGVTVVNVPSYGGSTVAEYAFTLLLMLTRRMTRVITQTNTCDPNRSAEQGMDLHGKTIGIIGTGSIGLGVAKIARGFGMNILGYDIYERPDAAGEIGFTYKPLDELLKNSDVITLHVPYFPDQNHHFINDKTFAKTKKGAILINTARGELVDTAALVRALDNMQLSAAGLDVLEDEKLLKTDEVADLASQKDASKDILNHAVAISALQDMSNVIITNHNAYNTAEALERINQTTADSIAKFFDKKEVPTV